LDQLTRLLPKAEQLPLRLRVLYESYGYSRYRMGSFEPYDLYMENRHFLRNEGVITFTDAAGRLMALKPDVTISIVKNTGADIDTLKLYYNENVFRLEYGGGEYREIRQMGLEYIGAGRGYAQAEVVGLALASLEAISREYTLDISHMGFIAGLIRALELDERSTGRVLEALRSKNRTEIAKIAGSLPGGRDARETLTSVAQIRGPLGRALEEAAGLCLDGEMRNALQELQELEETLRQFEGAEKAYLDFSVINDLDYYNGIVFRGYVREAPRAVLAGGRYDNLLRRFGKPQPAMGFALYLSDLDRVFHEPREYDADVLLLYGEAPGPAVAGAVSSLISRGFRVRAEKCAPRGVRARQVLRINSAGELEAVQDD
jgi:ATP phosphoribosyltransferase regulatory subunit